MKKLDVAIIGAGTAGLSARREIARHTDDYLVFDGGILGTTCARVGCMPSKAFIQIAHEYHDRGKKSESSQRVMEEVRELRDRFVRATMKSYEGWSETHLIKENATILGANLIEAKGVKYEVKKIIVATGSSPVIPEDWKPYKKFLWDTDHFFEEEKLPGSIAVIGLGPLGLELGQALSRLGVKVYGIDQSKSIAGLSDPDLIEEACLIFNKEMDLDFSPVESFQESEGEIEIKTKKRTIKVEKVLIAIGRSPNLKKLNLESLGLPLDKKGVPEFDPNTLQIGNTNVFITGDANAHRALLHEAADEGAIAGFHGQKGEGYQRRIPLAIVFTEPNIALVGRSHRELQESGKHFVEGKVSFQGQGRAIILGEEKGLLKVYGDPRDGRLLGAEICAPRGEHLAHLLAWVIQLKLTVADVLKLPVYHPTLEEGLRSALRDLEKKVSPDRSSLEIARCWDHPTCES